jgi:hypothetical protein
MRRPIRTMLAVSLLALALVPAARAGGPGMLIGAVEPEAMRSTVAEATAQLALAQSAGLGDAVRVVMLWARGKTAPDPDSLTALRNALAAAAQTRTTVYLIALPSGSSQTPLTAADQAQFAGWLQAIAQGAPLLRHVIVGNEPNLNRYWLPQFGPDGEDVAAASYEATLAAAYDALKQVSPAIEVLGGALAHAGVDRPGTGRDTHSPAQFILDMGTAYRASGRTTPIMDAFSYHPYMLDSNEPPTTTHPGTTTITIADYPTLVARLGEAFDGTAQQGSTLPIVYDEFGVQSTTPPDKASLYTGHEASTVHPVDEATQASFYAQAIGLAFCQPNVRAFLVFPLIDEQNLLGWQSGLYYADETPKSSLAAVRAAAIRARRNEIATCPGLSVTPRPTVVFFPSGRPGAAPSTFPVALTCDVDCRYRLRVEKLPGHSTTLARSGSAPGGVGLRVTLPRARLAPGRYRFTLTVGAALNAGPPRLIVSPPFTVPAG